MGSVLREYLPRKRLRLIYVLALLALAAFFYVQFVLLPDLRAAEARYDTAARQMHAREQSAALAAYAPLAARLQQPLPSGSQIVDVLTKLSERLNAKAVTYNLGPVREQAIATATLTGRQLEVSMNVASDDTAWQFWQDVRQSLPCEVLLTGLTLEGTQPRQARVSILLLGMPE